MQRHRQENSKARKKSRKWIDEENSWLGTYSVKEGQREREREADRQADREVDRDRDTKGGIGRGWEE